jgi:hypothetical protein
MSKAHRAIAPKAEVIVKGEAPKLMSCTTPNGINIRQVQASACPETYLQVELPDITVNGLAAYHAISNGLLRKETEQKGKGAQKKKQDGDNRSDLYFGPSLKLHRIDLVGALAWAFDADGMKTHIHVYIYSHRVEVRTDPFGYNSRMKESKALLDHLDATACLLKNCTSKPTKQGQ